MKNFAILLYFVTAFYYWKVEPNTTAITIASFVIIFLIGLFEDDEPILESAANVITTFVVWIVLTFWLVPNFNTWFFPLNWLAAFILQGIITTILMILGIGAQRSILKLFKYIPIP